MEDEERGCGFNLFDVFYVRERESVFWAQIKREKERMREMLI